jgi:hypothetical protein
MLLLAVERAVLINGLPLVHPIPADSRASL